MRPLGSASIQAGVFVLLVIASIGMKAIAGPPRDGSSGYHSPAFEKTVEGRLAASGFHTQQRKFRYRSNLFLAERGACRLAVRDARDGAASATAFARDARGIGKVRYLYAGRVYDAPPAVAMRIGRLKTELLTRLGMSPSAPVPVAFAASPECGSGNFRFEDVRLDA